MKKTVMLCDAIYNWTNLDLNLNCTFHQVQLKKYIILIIIKENSSSLYFISEKNKENKNKEYI